MKGAGIGRRLCCQSGRDPLESPDPTTQTMTGNPTGGKASFKLNLLR